MTTNLISSVGNTYPLLPKRNQRERIFDSLPQIRTQKARNLNGYSNNQAQIASIDINPAPRKSMR